VALVKGELPAAVAILIAGFAVTYVWRFLGAVAVSHLNPESEMLLWVRAVATALVAALVLRIVVVPEGLLAHTSALSRFGALAAGIAAFFLRRHVETAVAAAIAWFLLSELALN
jgi:branched-subunit amino acid transport protein